MLRADAKLEALKLHVWVQVSEVQKKNKTEERPFFVEFLYIRVSE